MSATRLALSAHRSLKDSPGRAAGPTAFKAGAMGDPCPAGSIPVHLCQTKRNQAIRNAQMKPTWSCYRQAVLTYQSHIHSLARDIAGRTSRILVQLTECVANPVTSEHSKLEIIRELGELKRVWQEMSNALPGDLKTDDSSQLDRHIYYIDYWIRRDQPKSARK